MLAGFEKIVEERIKQAQRKGDFQNLSGAGRPLRMEDDFNIPEDLRMAYKVLKNADLVPPEIELKKEILQTEDLLAGMQDAAEKYKMLQKLNLLIMKFNALRQGCIEFDAPQKYFGKLVDRIGKSKSKTDASQVK